MTSTIFPSWPLTAAQRGLLWSLSSPPPLQAAASGGRWSQGLISCLGCSKSKQQLGSAHCPSPGALRPLGPRASHPPALPSSALCHQSLRLPEGGCWACRELLSAPPHDMAQLLPCQGKGTTWQDDAIQCWTDFGGFFHHSQCC